MKTQHYSAIAATLAGIGIIAWVFAPIIWYIGLFLLIAGALFVVAGLWRFTMPAISQTHTARLEASREKHDQSMAWESLELQKRVLAHAERYRGSIKLDTNGTVEVIVSGRVEVEEDPIMAQPQMALPAPRQDECLNLSPDFQPHADTILSQRGMFVGISGSGKSNSLATMHEELGRLLVPFLLIDTEGEYGSLCVPAHLPRGQRVDASQVNVENAKAFGRYIIENHLQVILDVTSYEADEAAFVIVNALAGLNEWEEELENANRLSFMITLSEAGAWFPQSSKAVPYSEKAYGELQTTFFTNLVPRGRKRGLGLIFDLQRPAQVDKRLMQTSWKILHRQTEPRDIAVYGAIAGLEREEIISLGDGEAYIFSSQVSKYRTQIRRRYTQHEANTPGLASIQRRQYALQMPENFGENFDTQRNNFGGFAPANKPFRNTSPLNMAGFRNAPKGIPEETKNAILNLYCSGQKRTKIQELLELNGDEYWMVKEVCNEYDQQARRA